MSNNHVWMPSECFTVYFWCGANTSTSSFCIPDFFPHVDNYFSLWKISFTAAKIGIFRQFPCLIHWLRHSHWDRNELMRKIHTNSQRDMRHRKLDRHKYTHWGKEICIHWLDTDRYDTQNDSQTCCLFFPWLRLDLTSRGFQWKTSFYTLLLWFGLTHQSQLKSNHKNSHK